MKKVVVVITSLILALLIVFELPKIFDNNSIINANITNEKTLVPQEILSYENIENSYYKIYENGKLIGVVNDYDYFNSLIEQRYKYFEKDYPNTELGLSDNVYICKEKSFARFENCDEQIVNYLIDNDLLGIKTTEVEFSTSEGTYEIIYVKNVDDFQEARNKFLLNFVSEDTLMKIRNKEKIDSPTELGTVETNVSMLETISYKEAIVSPTEIFEDSKEIYDFLCYGRNKEREYYTVQEGDTLQGVGYHCGDMWPKQLVLINPDVLYSENQVITPGMKLNITYYTSPVTINVTKQVLSQQMITPETPEYIEDDTVEMGKIKIISQEEVGIKNVLFEEQWTNGVLQKGTQLSETVIKNPIRGIIAIGTKQGTYVGTGNYIWPVDNPYITTDYGGYYGHTGTDFINKYETYCNVYAVDNGVVDETGYKWDMGYYIMINHQNGVRTFYMHLNKPAYYREGDSILRGTIIGQEGNTGSSDGVHLHLTFEVDGTRVNACRYLPCNLIR